MDARTEAYLKVKPMISSAAWDLSRKYPNLTYEDAMGECNLQFARHVDAYNPEKGAITTYTASLLRTTKSNIQDRFCAERGIPRARRSAKTVGDSHIEQCKAIDRALTVINPQEEPMAMLDQAGYFDPSHILFNAASAWHEEDRALLNALYMGTEQGIEATPASIARNFPTWGKARAKARLSSLRKNVAEVLECTR